MTLQDAIYNFLEELKTHPLCIVLDDKVIFDGMAYRLKEHFTRSEWENLLKKPCVKYRYIPLYECYKFIIKWE